MRSILVPVLSASLILTTGCATILSGSTQKINVTTSNNQPASVNVQGKAVQVPAIIDVERRNEDIVLQATGKCEGQALAEKSINPVFFVNILSGGTTGSTTDYASDSMWRYETLINIKCS